MFSIVSESLINGIPQSLGNSDRTSFGYGKRDTWYTIRDGNWNDPSIWRTVSMKRTDYPGSVGGPQFDDVVIRHIVRINFTSIAFNNITVAPSASIIFNSALNVAVNGDIRCYGTWDMNSFANNVILLGGNSFINNFINTTNSIITYARLGDQNIIPVNHYNIVISGSGTKYSISDLTIAGTWSEINNGLTHKHELGQYNLTVNSTFAITSNTFCGLSKVGPGNILFIGSASISGGSPLFYLSGNPDIEFRGGIISNSAQSGININFGTGTVTFTTNSQSISWNTGTTPFTGNVLISGAITVTNGVASLVTFSGLAPDGDNASSALVNKGTMTFGNASSYIPMSTLGTFDKDNFANSLVYAFNGSISLPYNTYSGLITAGTGTKTLGATTTLSGGLSVQAGILDCAAFNLTVGTTTSISGTGSLAKSGAGSVLFTGLISQSSSAGINFTGNPTVELRGGYTFTNGTLTTGSGIWTFSTNSQSITVGVANITFACPILISGAITLTTTGATAYSISGTANGDNVGSTLDNRSTVGVGYKSATRPMITGVLQVNAAVNLWLYNGATNQDLTGGTYRNLTLAGGAFVKTQQGNISVINTYTLTAPTTKALNGFTFGNP